jgi:hypothetical protein
MRDTAKQAGIRTARAFPKFSFSQAKKKAAARLQKTSNGLVFISHPPALWKGSIKL